MEVDISDRLAAIDELAHLFVLIQAAGRKLSNEMHGGSYDLSQEMNELLSSARAKLGQIENDAFGSQARKSDRRAAMTRRLSDAGAR
jgi:hypothetical protein